MRYLIFTFLIFFGLFVFSINSNAQTNTQTDNEDTQIWTEAQVFYKINDKTEVFFNGALRLGRNVTHLIDERGGGGFVFKPNKYISVSPAYLYIAQQPSRNIKRYESRVNLAATLSIPIKKYTISDRNQFERRFLNSRKNTWRYRNRLQIERNFSVRKFKFNLYASNEVFYDSGAKAWTRNRALAGFTHKISPRYTIDIYGGRQNDGRSRPGNWNIIGTILRVNLN